MIWLWVGFFALILALLALDLGVLHRHAHVIGLREAVGWSALWISLALAFNGLVYFIYEHHLLGAGAPGPAHLRETGGADAAIAWFTGWLIEKSLSVDNIFVIALVFRYFKVPAAFQHRVLFWGILGALLTRGAMILAGLWLVQRFDWIFYVFGALLIASAVKMVRDQDRELDPGSSRLVRWARRVLPVTDGYHGARFLVRVDGRLAFTPLLLVLLVIETTDVVFAVDSIPAIFAITTDPFIVLTSNVFAILGLRALYFVLAGAMDRFRYLTFALTVILVMVGAKMLLHEVYPIPNLASLVFIAATLVVGVVASLLADRADGRR